MCCSYSDVRSSAFYLAGISSVIYHCLDENILFIFLTIKPTRCTNFSILFSMKLYMFPDSSSVHHQEFFTVHTAVVYVIQVCWQRASRIRMELSSILILFDSCQQTCMTYTFAVCTVKNSWWWTEELSKTCRVSFQNKIEKSVHLVGFIVRNVSWCTVTWTSRFTVLFIVPQNFFLKEIENKKLNVLFSIIYLNLLLH
jgi:hypothetical protein